MKTLGLLLLLLGILFTATIVLWKPGLFACGLGLLCYLAPRATAASQITRTVRGLLWAAIVLATLYGAIFWGYAISLQMHSLRTAVTASQAR